MAPKDKKKAQAAERPAAKTKFTKNPFVYALTVLFLVISIAAFVGLPTGDRGGFMSSGAFGTFAGEEIVYRPGNYFARAVQYYANQSRTQAQTKQQYYEITKSIWEKAFREAVMRSAAIHLAGKAGYVVAEKRLSREVLNKTEFHDENGKFSLEKFDSLSAAEQAKVLDGIRDDLIVSDYLSAIGDVMPPPGEAEFVKAMNGSARSFSYAAFDLKEDYPASEVIAFGKASPALFKSARVSYLKNDVSKSTLEKIRRRLSSGETSFKELLSKDSKDYTGAADVLREAWDLLDYFGDQAIVDAVMALKPGEYSEIVKTPDDGWIFYYCDQAAREPDFADQDDVSRVSGYLRTKQKGKVEEYLLKRAGEFAEKASVDWSAACAEFGVEPKKIASLSINYGNSPYLGSVDLSANPELSGAMSNEAFLTEAFSLKDKALSKPIALANKIIVLRMEGEVATAPSPGYMMDFYDYYVQQYNEEQLRVSIMKSPLLKNRFQETFDRRYDTSEESE